MVPKYCEEIRGPCPGPLEVIIRTLWHRVAMNGLVVLLGGCCAPEQPQQQAPLQGICLAIFPLLLLLSHLLLLLSLPILFVIPTLSWLHPNFVGGTPILSGYIISYPFNFLCDFTSPYPSLGEPRVDHVHGVGIRHLRFIRLNGAIAIKVTHDGFSLGICVCVLYVYIYIYILYIVYCILYIIYYILYII